MRHIESVFLRSYKGTPEYQLVYNNESMEFLGGFVSSWTCPDYDYTLITVKPDGLPEEVLITQNEIIFNTEEEVQLND